MIYRIRDNRPSNSTTMVVGVCTRTYLLLERMRKAYMHCPLNKIISIKPVNHKLVLSYL